MMVTGAWQQRVYGKLVATPQGPLLSKTEEHRCTGRSPGFPDVLGEACRPHMIGLGTDDLFNWRRYPWRERGGIVSQIVPAGDTYWRVAGRIRARSELSEADDTTRDFVQAHYLALPWGDWRPGMMAGLVRSLRAEPMTETDWQLPEIVIGDADAALPMGWLEDPLVLAILRAVMSGQTLAIIDDGLAVEDVLATLALCMAALPPDLTAVLPFGAGLAQVGADLAVGHGQMAQVDLRFVDGALRQGPNCDLSPGDVYIDMLQEAVRDIRTTHGLRQRIAGLPGLAEDRPSIPRPWTEIAQAIGGMLAERQRFVTLKAWLAGDSPQPAPRLAFQSLRAPVLAALLASPRGLDVIDQTENWRQAWVAVCQSPPDQPPWVAALAVLVDTTQHVGPAVLAMLRQVALPPSLARRAVARLDRDLAVSADPAAWLAWSQPGQANWVCQWREAAAARLLCLALPGLEFGRRQSASWDLAGSLADTAVGAAFAAMMAGAEEHDAATAVLRDLAVGAEGRDLPALRSLLGCAMNAGYFALACDLAPLIDRLGSGAWRERLLDPARLPQLATRIVERRLPLLSQEPVAVEIVLRGWRHLAPQLQSQAAPVIGRAIGQPYAAVLLGDQGGGEGRRALAAIARGCLDWTDALHRRRMAEWIIDHPEAVAVGPLLVELTPHLKTGDFVKPLPGISGLWAIAALANHRPPSLNGFDRADYAVLGRFARARGEATHWQEILHAADTAEAIAEILVLRPDADNIGSGRQGNRARQHDRPATRSVEPSAAQMRMLLRRIADDPALYSQFRQLTQRKGLDSAAFWRLLHGAPPGRAEEAAIHALDTWCLVSLAGMGVAVPPALLANVRESDIETVLDAQSAAEPGAELAFVVRMLAIPADPVLEAWLRYRARRDDWTREQIARMEPPGRLGLWAGAVKRRLQRPHPPQTLGEAVTAILDHLPPQTIEALKDRVRMGRSEG